VKKRGAQRRRTVSVLRKAVPQCVGSNMEGNDREGGGDAEGEMGGTGGEKKWLSREQSWFKKTLEDSRQGPGNSIKRAQPTPNGGREKKDMMQTGNLRKKKKNTSKIGDNAPRP